jgi:hypothetical protein
VTFANFWRVTPRVSVDADVSLTRARFVNVPADESRVPGALENVVAADIQYFYGSRLRGEPAGGVEDVHFHPVEPRQLRVSMAFGC